MSARVHEPAGAARETELVRTRPGPAFVLLHRWPGYVPGLVLLAAYFFLRGAMLPPWPRGILFAAIAWLALRAAWMTAAWLSRSYRLTDRHVTVRAGVLRRVVGEVPWRNVQHATMTRSPAERLFGLGTIGVATGGSDGAAIHLLMVPRPEDVLTAIRDSADRAQREGGRRAPERQHEGRPEGDGPGSSSPRPPLPPSHASRPLVIGLAGGIGAGKSEAARALARLGCAVVDSDEEARRVMDRPEVKATLAEWWGAGVIGADGHVDRSAIARIVFADAPQRRRLEGLVHPLIRAARAEFLARAGDAPGVVVDAPLLFEAGVDAECDGVIFVDAPREQRLERLRVRRGWNEAELVRREAAQMPVEEKRRRADEVVVNDSDLDTLFERVGAAFRRIQARTAAGPAPVARPGRPLRTNPGA